MRYTILIAIITLVFIGCSKDKFSTAPQLKYKEVNNPVVQREGLLSFTLSFTDTEGDVDSIYVVEVNTRCRASEFGYKVHKLPDFPTTKNQEGEILISYKNNKSDLKDPQCGQNDTCYFRFILLDKAKNTSDTVNSEEVVIIK